MIAIHKLPSAQTLAILVKRACLSEDDQLAIFLCATSMALEAVATLAENERGNAVLEETFKDASALASAMAEENRTEVLSVTHLGEDETVYDWRR